MPSAQSLESASSCTASRARPPAHWPTGRSSRAPRGSRISGRRSVRSWPPYIDTLLTVAPPTPAPILEAVAALAEFTARARSPIFFDARRGEIDLIPEPEAPGRLAKQFMLLARALAVVRQEPAVSLTSYATVVQVAN